MFYSFVNSLKSLLWNFIVIFFTSVCIINFHVDEITGFSIINKSYASDFGSGVGGPGPPPIGPPDDPDDDDDDDDDDDKEDGGGGGCGKNGGPISVIGGSASSSGSSSSSQVIIITEGNDGKEGEPVYLVNGAEKFKRTDLTINGTYPINLKRKYDSRSTYHSNLGYGWAFNYDQRLYEYSDGSVVIRYSCGYNDKFIFTGGAYQNETFGGEGDLSIDAGVGHILRHKDGSRDYYDNQGRLITKQNTQGHKLVFTYDPRGKLPLTGSSPYAIDPVNPMVVAYNYRLLKIEERLASDKLTGNSIVFTYDDATGRLVNATANDGRQVIYTHDTTDGKTLGNLLRVDGLNGFISSYVYADVNDVHNITDIQEGNNAMHYINTYNASDRVITQKHGNTIRQFDYVLPGVETEVTATITDENNENPQITKVNYEFDITTGKVIHYEDELGNWFDYEYHPTGFISYIRVHQNNGTKQEPSRTLLKTVYTDYTSTGNKLEEIITLDSGEKITKTWTYNTGRIKSYEVFSTLAPSKRFRTEYTYYTESDGVTPSNLFEEKQLKDDGSFQTTTYTYDSTNRLRTTTYPDGHIEESVYEDASHDYVTKKFHRVAGIESSYLKQRFGYNLQGEISDKWDAKNYQTHIEYDDKGRIKLLRNDLDEEFHSSYSEDRLLQREVGRTGADGEGQLIKYNYNSNHRLSSIQRKADDASWKTIESYTYYSDKKLHTKTDGEGNVWTYSYDAKRRLKLITDPNSKSTQYKYDAVGNRISVIDANINETKYTYDDLNRLIKTEQLGVSPSVVTTYSYDANNNLLTVTDAKNQTTTYTYDSLSRKTSETKPLGQTHQYFYDSRNRLDYTLNARNNKIDYSYNVWGPVDTIKFYADPATAVIDRTITYAYDFNGNVTSITDTATQAAPMYTINYDNLNRPDITTISYIPGGNITLNNDYDRYGNKDTLTLSDNSGVASHQYTYNKLNRLNNAVLPGAVNVGFDYFDNNRLKQLQFPNSLNIDYTFEPNGAVNNIKLSDGPTTIEQLTYAYDDVNNVDTITHSAGGVHDYDYDNVYRLSQATHPAGLGIPTTESFEYDAVGNREVPGDAAQYDYDINNRISKSPGITSYGYDNDGNTTSLSTGETYAYNHLNRLTNFTKVSLIADYKYDLHAKRIYKSINGVGTWYLWDSGKLLAEYNNSGQREKRYAYLPNRHTPTQIQDNNAIYTSFNDHLDTPRLLVDASNAVTWKAEYESFGATSVNNNPDGDSNIIEFNMRYPGQYYDQETNLYYNYFRYYDPETGRYITSDPIGLNGGINIYTYVRNNPLLFIDPFGLDISYWGGIEHPSLGDLLGNDNGNLWNQFTPQDGVCSLGPIFGPLADRCIKPKCQKHDNCFSENECNVSSWATSILGGTKACNQCNSGFFD